MISASRSQQLGITVLGFVFVCLFSVVTLVVAFRTIPAYLQHYKIVQTLDNIALNSEGPNNNIHSATDIRKMFQRQVEIDDIDAVSAKDLKIEPLKQNYRVSVNYEVRVNLMSNIALLLTFNKEVQVARYGG